MKKLIVLSLLLICSSAYAATGIFLYEERDPDGGFYKICWYDHLGEEVAITIKSVKLCPLTYNF